VSYVVNFMKARFQILGVCNNLFS